MTLFKLIDFLAFIYRSVFYYTVFNWKVFFSLPWWAKMVSVSASMVIFIITLILAVEVNFLGFFGNLPDTTFPPIKEPVASEMYSSDGVLLARYYSENRAPVKYRNISPWVIKCLIATEDIRFYKHSGIDFVALMSAFWANLNGERRGASTLTQQLAKNLFKTRENSLGILDHTPGFRRLNYKLKEWILAVKLEMKYSKEEILTMYLNSVDFGKNSFGIRMAARNYFDLSARELNVQQAATLIGLLKATTFYNPVRNPDKSKKRRNDILGKLKKYGYLSVAEYDSLIRTPLNVQTPRITFTNPKIAPYFRARAQAFVEEWCARNKHNLYTDGLKIYTTLDTRMQKLAEQAMARHLSRLQEVFFADWANSGKEPWDGFQHPGDPQEQFLMDILKTKPSYQAMFRPVVYIPGQDPFRMPKRMKIFTWQGVKDTLMSTLDSLKYNLQILQSAMLSIDPHNGYVKTWVGGIDYGYSTFDHVSQAKRQPGSTFKPFVYTEAMEQGYGPCDKLIDTPFTLHYVENGMEKTWTPRNSDDEYVRDYVTLRKALSTSKNTVTAQLTQKIGLQSIKKRARLMGIQSPLDTVPSLGLGSNSVSLLEMTSAYASFLNKGEWLEPQLISQIEDSNGNVIFVSNPKRQKAMSEETAYLMTYMLKGSIEEQDGTSHALFEYPDLFEGNELAGKTGTSSDYADGWYIGLTKDLVTGVWVGADDHRIRFRHPDIGEASQTALPIFGLFLEKVYRDSRLGVQKGKFPEATVEISKDHHCRTPFVAKKKKKKEEPKKEQKKNPMEAVLKEETIN